MFISWNGSPWLGDTLVTQLIFVETRLSSVNFIFNVCAASCGLAQLLLLADGLLEAQA